VEGPLPGRNIPNIIKTKQTAIPIPWFFAFFFLIKFTTSQTQNVMIPKSPMKKKNISIHTLPFV
jgi:hypothetical protein